MMYEPLIQYGAIGITAIYLFLQNQKFMQREDKVISKLTDVIEKNTVALTKFYEVLHDIKN